MPAAFLGPEFEQYMTEEEKARMSPAVPRDFIPPPPPKVEPPVQTGGGLGGSHPAPKQKKMTPEELLLWATMLQEQMGQEHDARMKIGPSVRK